MFSQKIKDTVFLKKEKNHSIYIDSNPYSPYYEMLTNFKSSEKNKNLINDKDLDLPKKWIKLYLYKNNYVLYAPCDWCYNSLINFSSKNIFFEECEFSSNKVLLKNKIKKNKYLFKFENSLKKKTKLTISIVDPKRGIAIFEFENEKNGKKYELFLDCAKIKNHPVIVNDCKFNKTSEFNFDEIDFKKLLN